MVIWNVTGNTNANTQATITVLSATTFSLNGVAGNAAYGAGGEVSATKLGTLNYSGLSGVTVHDCGACLTPEPSAACGGGSGTVTDGQNLNVAGETWWYTGTGSFAGGLAISANATLRICGNLTIAGTINVTSDCHIIIESGGSLTLQGAFSPSAGTITNYGTFSVNGGTGYTLNNSYFINALSTSVLNVRPCGFGGITNNLGSKITNKGIINTTKLLINATNPQSICIQSGSNINISNTCSFKPIAYKLIQCSHL